MWVGSGSRCSGSGRGGFEKFGIVEMLLFQGFAEWRRSRFGTRLRGEEFGDFSLRV